MKRVKKMIKISNYRHDVEFEKALRKSIAQDLVRYSKDFNDQRDVIQAMKIVEKKN